MGTPLEPRKSMSLSDQNHGTSSESNKHDEKPSWTSTPKTLMLSPSPVLVEPRKASKDDSAVATPTTPKRPHLHRGLSLQLPKQDLTSPSATKLTNSPMTTTELSPKLEPSIAFESTASVLPRRSRGLDFSRACTNLHHSTLADQSSPDSSPVIGGKVVTIPRKGVSGPDSPMFAGSLWSTITSSERTTMSGSMGSVNMVDSGSNTSDSDEDMFRGGEEEDTIHMTPQPFKTNFLPFSQASTGSPGVDSMNSFSPTAANLMSFKRRLRSGPRSRNVRKGSSSASLQSSLPSPGPLSPPLRSVENGPNGNYFAKEMEKRGIESRRESLSLGTNDLHISDSGDGDSTILRNASYDALGLSSPQVVRRTVTRRSNMLVRMIIMLTREEYLLTSTAQTEDVRSNPCSTTGRGISGR